MTAVDSRTRISQSVGCAMSCIASLLVLVLALFPSGATAQQLTGTLSGTAYDQTGAVVPSAKVVLKNEASGDIRDTVTDRAGHFAISAVQPANYSLVVSAKGFSSWEENGIVMGLGDTRDVPNIKLQAGGNAEQIDVVAGADVVVPTDTAEISTSLNEQFINDFPLQGRDAGELLKIAPGMALNNGINQGTGFNDKLVGSNNGPVGSYSANGTQPNGSMAFLLDGANLVDPGNFGTQIANINPDMVQNVKILMSNYGAEFAKGPVIFEAFSKSGGQKFHGEGYLYTHNGALNSVDAYSKARGGTNIGESYYYMGGNVGGPVILPFLKWNRDRKKLFFWGGYEYMKQQPAGSILSYNVPNPAQLSGDFSNTGVDPNAISTWPGFYSQITANVPTGGSATSIPKSDFDPNIPGVLKLYPAANVTPSKANGYTNYQYSNTSPQNRWEATGKVSYSLSDNTKVNVSLTHQEESDLAPISVWWSAPWTLPYPAPAASKTTTNVLLTNFTHVFNATTTNEFVFTWSHFVNPYTLSNANAVSRATTGFGAKGLFGTTTAQIPNFEGPWGGTLANLGSNYSFTTGSFGGTKQVPAIYDNFSKLIGNHTTKAGFYWDNSSNKQSSAVADNGIYNFGGSNISTNNYVADLELGNVANYSQQNYAPVVGLKYHQWSLYAQDSWKATRKLTVNYGLRFDHVGQWYGTQQGLQVWDPASYVNSTSAPNNTGIKWNATDSSVPLSGFASPVFYYAPRIGLAYDVFGTGKTVLRGGYATYRYQTTANDAGNTANGPLSSFGYTTPTAFTGYANVSNFAPPSTVAQNGGSVYVMQKGDTRAPYTNDWNVTVSQALKWRSVVEVSWVGNKSLNENLDGANSNLGNLNNVAPGAFFGKDPVTGRYLSPSAPPCSNNTSDSIYCAANPGAYSPSFNANDYRPLVAYQNVYYITHAPYSNYNSLQVSFQKQSGPVTFVTNYTFSKVLGIRDGGSSNGNGNGTGVDPFVIGNNYGVLAYDHTNILNLSSNWRLPKPIHGDGLTSHLLAGAVNGWQLSNYTAFQSGAPLQPGLGGSFNLNANANNGLTVPTIAHPDFPDYSFALPNGLRATSVNTSTWFGSNAYNVLVPALTCNPTKNLAKGQRFNPNCFTLPAYGQQGQVILPYMRAPNYWDSDLGLYKSFRVVEGQRVEFRASANNWLNHPLGQFGLANNSDESILLYKTAPGTCGSCTTTTVNPTTGVSTTTTANVTSISPTNTNTQTTGTPAFKTGSRFITLAVKYYF